MSRFISKKRALLTAAVTSLVLVAVAVAYYTTLGEGTGTGTTDAAYANKLVIEGNVPAGVVPGATVNLTGEKVTNPNGGHARVTTVVATDIDVGGDDEADGIAGPSGGDCNDSWFSIADVPVNVNLAPNDSAAGGADETTFAAQIVMQSLANTNQDACKSDAIAIEWDSDDSE